jgi:hypothetical protein
VDQRCLALDGGYYELDERSTFYARETKMYLHRKYTLLAIVLRRQDPQNTIAISAKYPVSFICQPTVFEDTIAKIHPINPT